MLRQTLSQVQTLRQEQIMAPQQIQSLEILLATTQELEQKISEEISENPTLELLSHGTEDLVGNPIEQDETTGSPDQEEAAARAAERDETLAALIELNAPWQDGAYKAGSVRHYTAEDEERRQYMLDSLVSAKSLQDVLLEQLRQTEGLDQDAMGVCEEVIGSIDDTGYLRSHVADIAISSGSDMETVERALAVVQGLDPPGIGARDLRECLVLQLKRSGRTDTFEYEVVDKYLEDVGRNQIPKIARAMGISPARLYEALDKLKKLTPFPGSQIAPARPDYVVPEVFIERDDKDAWAVRTNRECFPRLRISPYYLNLLQSPDTPQDVKTYIRQKMTNSKMLLRALDQRASTIERIADCLLQFQPEFFERGIDHLRPLTMSRVADEIGVHETTVSRAVAGKYLQTPHGLFPFRQFFASGIDTGDGAKISSVSVKQKLQETVEQEDSKHPLSDQRLAAMLKGEGYRVARRTIAKYREELGILPSHLRRSF